MQLWNNIFKTENLKRHQRMSCESSKLIPRSQNTVTPDNRCCDGGKNYCDWSRLKGNDQLVILLQKQLEKQNSNLVLGDANQQIFGLAPSACISMKTGNNSPADQVISGTYCHPDLIPHIACWISHDFAILISKVINGHIVQEYKQKLEMAQIETEATGVIQTRLCYCKPNVDYAELIDILRS